MRSPIFPVELVKGVHCLQEFLDNPKEMPFLEALVHVAL
jgi:hypothetical protein